MGILAKSEAMKAEYLIGIDPSFTNCAAAIYHPATNGLQLHTGDLFSVMAFLNQSGVLGKCIAVVENPNLDSNTFGMWAMMKAAIIGLMQGRVNIGTVQSTFARYMKVAQDIGKSKASAQLLLEMFRRQSIPVLEVKPSSRDRADKVKNADVRFMKMPTKTNAAQFATYAGFPVPKSNEHSRDAATLCLGRNIEWAQRQLMLRKK